MRLGHGFKGDDKEPDYVSHSKGVEKVSRLGCFCEKVGLFKGENFSEAIFLADELVSYLICEGKERLI